MAELTRRLYAPKSVSYYTFCVRQAHPKAPSSKHLPQANMVPTAPLRMSPCPPQRLKPPGTSTTTRSSVKSPSEILLISACCLPVFPVLVQIMSSLPFCRTVTPPSARETSIACSSGGAFGSTFYRVHQCIRRPKQGRESPEPDTYHTLTESLEFYDIRGENSATISVDEREVLV